MPSLTEVRRLSAIFSARACSGVLERLRQLNESVELALTPRVPSNSSRSCGHEYLIAPEKPPK